MNKFTIAVLMLIIIAAAGWAFLAKFAESPNLLAAALFVLIAGLSLASLRKPELKILSFSISSIVLFYGWINSANVWYLAGAISLAIAAVASSKVFKILAVS